jgi:hypothetical protein
MRWVATLASACAVSMLPVATANADPDTGQNRILDCGDAGTLTVVLSPNAFSASVPAFHVTDSTAVLTPLNVEVNGEFVIRSAPGALRSAANVVACSYTDPAGLFVEITGVLTSL